MNRYGPVGSTEGHLKAKTLIITVAIAASMTLGGCSQIKKLVRGKPAGQVVATVNGDEITALELQQELNGFTSRDPAIMKQAQQQALQQVIMRHLLVQKAKADKLDKSPEYTLQVLRGEQALLAQSYQRKIAASVAVPARQDAETFVNNNPGRFAQRRVLTVDQIIVPPNKIDPARFKPLNTLEDVKALFEQEGAAYQENVTTVDTLTADPRLVQQVDKLPPGEVFVVPQGGALIFNRVSQVKSVPFHGDAAIAYAVNVLRNQKAQETVRSSMEAMRKAAESKIVYNAAYKPVKAPAAKLAPPTAPAAAPPAKAP